MSTDYDPSLFDEISWVRLQIGDRGTANATTGAITGVQFSDEEIGAILGEEGNKYLAAARLGEAFLQNASKGLLEKRVGTLQIRYSEQADSTFRQHIQTLRERGAELLQGSDRITFTVL